MLTLMNGVEDCPVSCLSNFSLVNTLLAKLIASLRLFTLIKVNKVGMDAFLHSLALLLSDPFLGCKSLSCLYCHQI